MKAKIRREVFLWGPVFLAAGTIFYLSSLNQFPAPLIFFVKSVGDKTAHAVEYLVLAILITRACHGGLTALKLRPALLALTLTIGYGLSDEWHQSFVPLRDSSFFDFLADTGGAVTALLLWWLGSERLRNFLDRLLRAISELIAEFRYQYYQW